MSTVVITVTPPGGSPTDITNSCVFDRCSFESEFNGAPGTFDLYVRDPDLSLSFETGDEVLLTVDSVTLFGGFVTQVGMTSFAPAADTSDLDTYNLGLWHLSGSDYNVVFDRRVFRNEADYLKYITINETVDGAILRSAITNYTDMDDFDTSGIDDIATIPDITHVTIQQGWTVRKEFETLLPFSGAVYYIDGDKKIIYKAYDNAEKRWGFSDAPNHNAITASPDEYQGATYGFSRVEGTEDASYMANDVFMWGGSEFAGTGGTVFHRSQDSTSQDDHGRWQYAETHFGEQWFKTNAGVTAAANAILEGPPGTDATGQQKGLKNPQRQFTFTWYSDQVPLLSGTPDHIRAGDLVTINLSVFDDTRLLPVRSIRISFPDAFEGNPATDDRLVQFDGTFGLQLSDSFTLWRYVIKNNNRVVIQTQVVVSDDTDPASGGGSFGASYSGIPSPSPDGSTTVFTIPFAYIPSTTQVFLNGLKQRLGIDYTESNNTAGEITFVTAPLTTDTLTVTAYTQGAAQSSGPLPPVTDEFSGSTISALDSFVAGLPDGSSGSPTVIGLPASASITGGASDRVQLSGRHHLVFVGRGATLQRTSRGTTPIFDMVAGTHDIRIVGVGTGGQNPGEHDVTYEHEHGFSVFSCYNIEIDSCSATNIGGDGVDLSGSTFFDTWSDNVWVHNSTFDGIGRNGISFTDGISRATVERCFFQNVYYYTFDFEPNGLTIDGRAAGAVDIEISNNTTGTHPYGLLADPADFSAGVVCGMTGASGGGPITRVIVQNTGMTSGQFTAITFDNGVTCTDIAFIANQGVDNFTANMNGWGHAFIQESVNGLTIRSNVQPCSTDSDFETHSGSNVDDISGNVF